MSRKEVFRKYLGSRDAKGQLISKCLFGGGSKCQINEGGENAKIPKRDFVPGGHYAKITKRELLPKCLRGRLLWWEIIPEGVLFKLSKREKMPVRKRCQGEKYVIANENIYYQLYILPDCKHCCEPCDWGGKQA